MSMEDSMILDVEANRLPSGKIRLKYLAISGGCGPELSMDVSLAEQTIQALRKAIDQVKS